jgi:DNA polymerase (family 10)
MSTNDALAARFGEMATHLELLGADAFKSRAYASASRAFESMTRDVGELVRGASDDNAARASLREIDGIGAKLADKVVEFVRTGTIAEADELRAQVPPGLAQVLGIQGLGPKTVRVFWQQAGVTDLAGLRRIIEDGTILGLPRMGAKAVEKIKAGMQMLVESDGRLHLGPASAAAERVVALLRGVPGVIEAEAAGSLRRGKESVGDLDVLVSVSDAGAAARASEAFRSMPGVVRVLAAGETKSSVRVATGLGSRWEQTPASEPVEGDALSEEPAASQMPAPEASTTSESGPSVQVDLRVVAPDAFGAALAYFTGSKEHNVRMRQRAIERGFTLNEYGLFRAGPDGSPVGAPVAARTEREIFSALGLPWIPPEMREDRGELALAQAHDCERALISVASIRSELHAHTTASDGLLSIVELARSALARGFHTIAVTDHSRSSTIARGLDSGRLRRHVEDIKRACEQVQGVTILAGSEVDILADGRLDYDDDVLALLDIVVASPHAALSQEPALATARMLKALAHPAVRILGHPTGRLVMRRAGLDLAMGEIIACAREHDVALEINAHWMRLDLRDTHARAARDAGALIAINCDVHQGEDFDNLRFGVMTARRAWIEPERCVNTWTAERLRAWIGRR